MQSKSVESFRAAVESKIDADSRFKDKQRADREDGSTLATRWRVGPAVWIEVAVRPLLPQVRVGLLTDDRWKSEDLEEKIQESGDTMNEFVGMGMHEAGIDWEEPPVEHYRAELKFFYFATPVDLHSADDLGAAALHDKAAKMAVGYLKAFEPFLAG